MILRDIEAGKFFVFDGDTNYPQLRVETGYLDIVSEQFRDNDMGLSVLPVERWVVEKALYQYEMFPQDLTAICEKSLALYKKPNYEEKKIFFFQCTNCKGPRRNSLNKDKASAGLCRKCRKLQPDPRQTTLFPPDSKAVDLGAVTD